MADWELALLLLGAWLLGCACGLLAVIRYAQHVYRQEVGSLIDGAGALTTMAATGRPVTPPPPRSTTRLRDERPEGWPR